VAWAYIRGLERRAADGKPVNEAASVASFFISRIDTVADHRLLQAMQARGRSGLEAHLALRGQLGIANARVAYGEFIEIFASDRFQRLANLGARVQRPLWASTSTKNPDYGDVHYLNSLIGPDTVNTVPLETILAFVDHGQVSCTLDEAHIQSAVSTIQAFEELGICLGDVAQVVLDEGIQKFVDAYDQLLAYIASVGLSAG
jgi:transaldolase